MSVEFNIIQTLSKSYDSYPNIVEAVVDEIVFSHQENAENKKVQAIVNRWLNLRLVNKSWDQIANSFRYRSKIYQIFVPFPLLSETHLNKIVKLAGEAYSLMNQKWKDFQNNETVDIFEKAVGFRSQVKLKTLTIKQQALAHFEGLLLKFANPQSGVRSFEDFNELCRFILFDRIFVDQKDFLEILKGFHFQLGACVDFLDCLLSIDGPVESTSYVYATHFLLKSLPTSIAKQGYCKTRPVKVTRESFSNMIERTFAQIFNTEITSAFWEKLDPYVREHFIGGLDDAHFNKSLCSLLYYHYIPNRDATEEQKTFLSRDLGSLTNALKEQYSNKPIPAEIAKLIKGICSKVEGLDFKEVNAPLKELQKLLAEWQKAIHG